MPTATPDRSIDPDLFTLVADKYGQEAAEYLREKVHSSHEHRWVDYGVCKGCGATREDREAAHDVAHAAHDVASALYRLVEATEERRQSHGPRADGWATGYPAQRDMTEEADAWSEYAEVLREPLPDRSEPEPAAAPAPPTLRPMVSTAMLLDAARDLLDDGPLDDEEGGKEGAEYARGLVELLADTIIWPDDGWPMDRRMAEVRRLLRPSAPAEDTPRIN